MAEKYPGGRVEPRMLAIAGDSGSGKTTITKGLVQALGPDRLSAMCVDDYHRYDRDERRTMAQDGSTFTPLSPLCNYVGIMENHIGDLARGKDILKPKYNHATGKLDRPVLFRPEDFVIVEGLLPLHTRRSRLAFNITVYLDPPEPVRYDWKIARDRKKRGYTLEEVEKDLARREVESAAFIRPQRADADIVVRFAPAKQDQLPKELEAAFEPSRVRREAAPLLLAQKEDDKALIAHRAGALEDFDRSWEATQEWVNMSERPQLSATLLLRPTLPHPNLNSILTDSHHDAIHLKLVRDEFGKPVDALHIHAHAPREMTAEVEHAIWDELGVDEPFPETLGQIEPGVRSEPLAITQLILLYHLLRAVDDVAY